MLTSYFNLPRTVHLLCLGAFVNRAGAFLAPFLTIYLKQELNLSVGFATWAISALGVGSLFASLIGGDLADRVGRRPIMVISLLASAVMLIVFSSLSSRWAIIVALLGFSLVSDMYRPAASAMIADVTEPNQRPQAYGLMYVAINLGFAVAAVIGGRMALISFKLLFWADALTAAAFGIMILLVIRETLPSRKATRTADLNSPTGDVEAKTPDQSAEASVSLLAATKHILTDFTFVFYWIATFFLASMYMQAFTTFPLYLGGLGFNSATYGKLIAVNGFMIVALQLPTTSLITRFHRGNMVTLSAIITAVGLGLTGLAVLPWHFSMAVVVWTCGEMMNAPLMQSIVADLAPVHLRARYMGALSICFSSALIVGPKLGGYALEHLGDGFLWGGTTVVGLLAACLYGAMRQRVAVKTE